MSALLEPLAIDTAEARRYVLALTGDEETVVTYQTFSDLKPNPVPPEWEDPLKRVLHGTLEERLSELISLNERGAGVFVTVNETDLRGRRTENVSHVRALFIDEDGPRTRPYALPPSFRVLSGGRRPDGSEKAHAYWIAGDVPLAEFKAAQKRLAAFYGSDPDVNDLPRVMRVPGFLHRKAAPRPVTLESGSGEVYTFAEILAAHPVEEKPRPAPRPVSTPPVVSTDRERKLLEIARTKAEARPWDEGSRHHSAKETAAHARKLGLPEEHVLALVGDLLEKAGKDRREAEAIVTWTMENVSPDPDEAEPPKRATASVTGGSHEVPPVNPLPPLEVYDEDGGPVTDEPAEEARPFPWIDLAEFRREMMSVRDTRQPTGIPTLDLALKGGLPGGVVVTLVGPAGSCKSVLAIQLGLCRARANGGRLYVYSPDQGGTQPLERLAETFGDIAEDDGAFRRFVEGLGDVVRVADEREASVSMESFAAEVMRAGDAAAVLIDTPQTVAVDGNGERERIDASMEMARQIARGCLVPVLVASHAGRGATAARKREDRNRELSAGLGSAKIEHRSQVVLYLDKQEREDGITEIEVRVPKASFGQSGRCFRLALDPATWSLREIDRQAAEDEQTETKRLHEEKLAKGWAERILAEMKREPGGASATYLGKVAGLNSTCVSKALRYLRERDRVFCEQASGRGGNHPVWKVANA